MMLAITIGKCEIEHGNPERNWFIYFSNGRRLTIDLDSDYRFEFRIGHKNHAKALAKAKRIASAFIGCQITAKDLIDAGFEHDIPESKMRQLLPA